MIISLKAALGMLHPALGDGNDKYCDLRTQDPEFNKGKGEVFRRAFDRAIRRGDFR